MTREEAIKWIDSLSIYLSICDNQSLKDSLSSDIEKTIKALDMAIEALKAQENMISLDGEDIMFVTAEEYKTLKAQEWIPASKKPEEEEKTYLIQTDGGYMCICKWTNVNHFWTDSTTDWHWHITDVLQYSKVIAWMSLPEPYDEEQNNE